MDEGGMDGGWTDNLWSLNGMDGLVGRMDGWRADKGWSMEDRRKLGNG